MAERAAPPGRLDVATVALGQLHFGLDDVLVAGHAPAAGPCQDDDLQVAVQVLDPRCLSDSQLQQCHEIYKSFRHRSLLPANEAYRDPMRKELDAALWHILELPRNLLSNLDLVREQWCAEPSVHGREADTARLRLKPMLAGSAASAPTHSRQLD